MVRDSHWARNFYGKFKQLYNVDKEALDTAWEYHGNLTSENANGVHLLLTPMPEYTSECMCGHFIVRNCVVSNGHQSCVVGSCCAKKFMAIPKRQLAQLKESKKQTKKMCRALIRNHVKKVQEKKDMIERCENQKPRFGKYKDKAWKDVPTNYIKWCVKKGIWFDHNLSQYIDFRIGL